VLRAPALLTSANAKPFLALFEMFTFRAGGIGGLFGVSFVMTASILKHRNEWFTIVGVKRIDREVGIDDGRLTQWVLPILLAVIAVPKLKCLSECRYDLVKIAFFVFRLIRYVFILKKRCKHCASFRIFSKKKNLPYLMIIV
jgi:hypothetical protein